MNFLPALAAAPEHTNLIAQFIDLLNTNIGSIGVTVIVFTLIFKFALMPLDLWQKFSSRKQNKKMAALKPQLAKLEQQYANKPDILKQKQAELSRGQMGMIGMCLPMIVTMIVFFVVLGGFNDYIRVENERIVYTIAEAYNTAIANGEVLTSAAIAELYHVESFLWIENIFMPDNWSAVIPTIDQYLGAGMGAIDGFRPDIANIPNWYETLIGPAADSLNRGSGFTAFFTDIGKWNGYMVLPILSVITSVFSTKLMSSMTPASPMGTTAQQEKSKKTQKIMMYMMPVMFGVFSLFYSSAFALYVFTSGLFSSVLGLAFNLITKSIDKKKAAQLNA